MSDDPNVDRINAAHSPVVPIRILRDSAYGSERTCKDSKGNALPACVPTKFHPGTDLGAPKGWPVFAPHDGWILFAGATSNAAPWQGYGPAVVLLAHDDVSDDWMSRVVAFTTPGWWPIGHLTSTAQSGVYSLLAHLEPALPLPRPMDSRVSEVWTDKPVTNANWRAVPGADGHAPQEVMTFQPGDGRALAVMAPSDEHARYVKAGDIVGFVGDAKHVHWEIRVSPLGLHDEGRTIDPIEWLETYKGPLNMPSVERNATIPDPPPSRGLPWWFWAGAAYVISEKL